MYSRDQQHGGYQRGFTPQGGGYPPQGGGYPPQGGGYPQQGGGYPPQGGGYPPQGGGYPQQGGGYPPQGAGYPRQGGYAQHGGFPHQPYGGHATNQPQGAAYASDGQSLHLNTHDADFSESTEFRFSEKSVRMAFIRKVYCILVLQLLVTMGIMAIFMFVDDVKDYSRKNRWIWLVAMCLSFVTLIALACCPDVRRNFPTNFILLFVFTTLEGVMLGTIAVYYEAVEVLQAVGITAVVALALTIFSFQTKWDFTYLSGILFVCSIVLMVFGFLCIFFYNRVVYLIFASLGALLFSVYLVVDTQLMMGGKHKYSLSPEEYIFAALNLYLDIVNMFIFILSILGIAND